jgi:hypothetical protein
MVCFHSDFSRAMNDTGPQFYFSLLRLMAMLRGGDARRAENNGAEAWLGGLGIYLVSYLFFVQFIPGGLRFWQAGLLLAGLAFLVWLFWLVVLYLNSLIIKFLRLCGVFRTIPVRRAQSILLATTATAMALSLLQRGSWITEAGAIWLVAVAMNLAAAAILAFRNGGHASD